MAGSPLRAGGRAREGSAQGTGAWGQCADPGEGGPWTLSQVPGKRGVFRQILDKCWQSKGNLAKIWAKPKKQNIPQDSGVTTSLQVSCRGHSVSAATEPTLHQRRRQRRRPLLPTHSFPAGGGASGGRKHCLLTKC